MIDKHACSAQCPCQQGKDKAIAERVVGRVVHKAIVERVASRYIRALDMGQGVFGDHLKIHHFSGSLKITDMTNAGKKGKKVRILSVLPGGHSSDDRQTSEELLKPLVDHILHMTYDQAKKAIEEINEENKDLNDAPFNIDEHEVRGIDVEPKGTVINLQKKFPNGTIVSIKASPHDFQVTNSVVIGGGDPENPKPAHGHRDDMNYWSRGRESGILFYGWLKDNVSKAANMTMEELKNVWHELGVKFDSH